MTERSITRLKSLVLILLAIFFAAMLVNGRLYFYIGPRFSWLALVATCLFILLAGAYNLVGNSDSGGHTHDLTDSRPVNSTAIWPILITAIPLLLAVIIPAKPLGATAISNRGVSTAFSLRSASAVASDPTSRTVFDWVAAISAKPDPASLNGQEADVIGFVYRDVRFGPDQFMLIRFTITCCVADALALGIVVRSPKSQQFAADSWVRVKGKFTAGDLDGAQMPVLVADDIAPIQQPEQPYLFP